MFTDVAARRLYIPEVDWIVQYDPLNDSKNEQNDQRPEWKRAHPAHLRADCNFSLSLLICVVGLVVTSTSLRWYKMIHTTRGRNLSSTADRNDTTV